MAITLPATNEAVDLGDESLEGCLDGGLVVRQGRNLSVQCVQPPYARTLKSLQASIHPVGPFTCSSHGGPELLQRLFMRVNGIFVLGQPALVTPNGLLNRLIVQRYTSSLATE